MARTKKITVCSAGMTGVGGKWKFWIWYHLLSGTKRFGELQRLIPLASRQMLTIQLRELEHMGILRRKVYLQLPPKVEYSLTDVGQNMGLVVRQVHDWGQWYCEQIGQEEFDWFINLGGKWKFWIWYHLLSGAKRFSELERLLAHASRQMLATQLRELELMGVLQHASEQGTSKVEYSLTELGRSSEPMLRQVYAWGKWYCEQVGLEQDWLVNDEEDVTSQ
jgi:DNA-binding HxlR family transcriptional regulator